MIKKNECGVQGSWHSSPRKSGAQLNTVSDCPGSWYATSSRIHQRKCTVLDSDMNAPGTSPPSNRSHGRCTLSTSCRSTPFTNSLYFSEPKNVYNTVRQKMAHPPMHSIRICTCGASFPCNTYATPAEAIWLAYSTTSLSLSCAQQVHK